MIDRFPMLFKQRVLDEIAAGRVTVAYRRWKRPTVKSGGTLQTPVGVLRICAIEVVDATQIGQASLANTGFETVAELLASLGDRGGDLYRIEFERLGDDPRIALRAESALSTADVHALCTRLDRLDSRSRSGPWTRSVLQLIAEHPELRAVELANRSHFEKEWLKTNIRKLKNMGLTESLTTGYRLSPRGRVLLAAISEEDA